MQPIRGSPKASANLVGDLKSRSGITALDLPQAPAKATQFWPELNLRPQNEIAIAAARYITGHAIHANGGAYLGA